MLNYTYNEELTIQYSGKETISKTKPRPWDFRPKLKSNEFYMPDLSFGDIWIELYRIHEKLDKKHLNIL